MAHNFKFSLRHIILQTINFCVLHLSEEQTVGKKYFEEAPDGSVYMGCEQEFRDKTLDRANVPEFWPNAQVPYTLSDNFRDKDHVALNAALEDYHKYTCIRFLPRTNEQAYVHILVDFNLTDICGSAQVCHHGEPQQRVRINSECSGKHIFIHELGHSLCLQHEQERLDRDDYLDLSKCEKPETISGKVDATTTRGNVYDYFSHMHYECSSCVGTPKIEGVVDCGASNELGAIDADKLNSYYNCQGCLRHRWYRMDSLTPEQQSSLVNFASQEGDNGPVYLCRSQKDAGEILPGRYIPEEKACLIVANGMSIKFTRDIQLLGIPGEVTNIIPNATGNTGYTLLDPRDNSTEQFRVRVGRNYLKTSHLAAVTWLVNEDGKKYTEIGRTRVQDYQAFFPKGEGYELVQFSDESALIWVLGCIE